MRGSPILVLILSGWIAGCIATRNGNGERTTWLDDELDGVADHRPRRKLTRAVEQKTVAREKATRDEATAPPKASPAAKSPAEVEPVATDLSAAPKPRALRQALLRFTAMHQKRWRRKEPRWPTDLVGEWRALLSDLRTGLGSPPVTADRSLLLQMRITVEAELQRDARRFGPAPADVVLDAQRVFVSVQHHLAHVQSPTRDRRPRSIALVWPVSPQILTSHFGYRRDPIIGRHTYRFHAGIDLGGQMGTAVVAAATGEVADAGWSGGHGRSITVRHKGGIYTVYSHLRRILVRDGQRVTQGQTIGLMGSSGRSTGPHLHFEVRRDNVPLDPLELLNMSLPAPRQRRAARAARR